MVSLNKIDEQLKQIGVNFQYWGRRELRELSKIMTQTEEIKQVVNGHYQGGFAMLVATNQRLLLIDRKPMFLTVEAIWYDKIGQVDFNHRLLNASICVSTPNKDLMFVSWNSPRLREIMLFTQEKMTEAKSYEEMYYKGRPQKYEARQYDQRRYFEQAPAGPRSVGAKWLDQEALEPQATLGYPEISEPSQNLSVIKNRLPYSRRRYFAGGEAA